MPTVLPKTAKMFMSTQVIHLFMVGDNGGSFIIFAWLSYHFTVSQYLQNHKQRPNNSCKREDMMKKFFPYCCQMFKSRTFSRIYIKYPQKIPPCIAKTY